MAGTTPPNTTRSQRRRQTATNLAEEGGGMAVVDPDPAAGELDREDGPAATQVVEHTLGGLVEDDGVDLDELEAEVSRNQGAAVTHAIDFDGSPRIGVNVDDNELLVSDADELPEPVVTEVRLALGRKFGTRVTKLVHQAGCPGRPERVESTPYETPRGARGVMVRCCDCAEQNPMRLTAPRRS